MAGEAREEVRAVMREEAVTAEAATVAARAVAMAVAMEAATEVAAMAEGTVEGTDKGSQTRHLGRIDLQGSCCRCSRC